MSSTGAEVVLPVTGGAGLLLRLPEAAVAEAAAELPVVPLSNLPGAAMPVRVGFRGDGLTLRAVCATARSSGWAPGVEDLVLARASQLATGALGGEVTHFEATDAKGVETRIEQRFEATVQRDGAATTARGRHMLGFAGEARDALVCTVVCTEREGQHACQGLVEAAAPRGAWIAAPDPSALVQGILLAADRPVAAAVILGATALALTALVLARRPRPRATSRRS